MNKNEDFIASVAICFIFGYIYAWKL